MGRKTKQNKITSPELIAQVNPKNIRLRHFFTTSLAKANLPDSVIKTIIGWESLKMVDIYKDIDNEEEIGKYFADGEIIAQKQTGLSDL